VLLERFLKIIPEHGFVGAITEILTGSGVVEFAIKFMGLQ